MTKRFTYADVGTSRKFDIQLGSAQSDEDQLALRLQCAKIELKTERFQWEKTGNLCIEYRYNGKPSGLSVVPEGFWFHELTRGEETLAYIVIPVPRLKEICRKAIKNGQYRKNVGDDGKSDVVLLKISDLLKYL